MTTAESIPHRAHAKRRDKRAKGLLPIVAMLYSLLKRVLARHVPAQSQREGEREIYGLAITRIWKCARHFQCAYIFLALAGRGNIYIIYLHTARPCWRFVNISFCHTRTDFIKAVRKERKESDAVHCCSCSRRLAVSSLYSLGPGGACIILFERDILLAKPEGEKLARIAFLSDACIIQN